MLVFRFIFSDNKDIIILTIRGVSKSEKEGKSAINATVAIGHGNQVGTE